MCNGLGSAVMDLFVEVDKPCVTQVEQINIGALPNEYCLSVCCPLRKTVTRHACSVDQIFMTL